MTIETFGCIDYVTPGPMREMTQVQFCMGMHRSNLTESFLVMRVLKAQTLA